MLRAQMLRRAIFALVVGLIAALLPTQAWATHAQDPIPEPDGVSNIPDKGYCGVNNGRWVKFTTIGAAVATGRINSGNPKWTGWFTSDVGHVRIYNIVDQNDNPVLYDGIAGSAAGSTRVWRFPMASSTPLLDAPNNGNFSQFAICAVGNTPIQPPTTFSGNIRGTVFRDYDMDGTRDDNRGLDPSLGRTSAEPGEPGINVLATDANGKTWTAASGAGGQYALSIVAAVSTDIRLEFTIPSPKSDWLRLGVGSAALASDVVFAHIGDLNVDEPVSVPSEYCGQRTDLLLIASCFRYGDHRTTSPGAAMRSWLFSAASGNTSNTTDEALESQTGATYGLAWARDSKILFAGAYQRRHSGFGPGGTGAIYAISSPGTGTKSVSVWADLNALFGAGTAGTDPHPAASLGLSGTKPWTPFSVSSMSAGESAWFYDVNSFDAVGKISLGDLEMGDDDEFVYAVNMADRSVYRIPAITKPTSSSQIARVAIPSGGSGSAQTCAASDTRPMALAFHDGKGYVGVVCSAQTSGSATDLYAYVYRFNPDTMVFESAPAVEFPLDYTRSSEQFRPWTATLPAATTWLGGYTWSAPAFSSIEFDGDDMVMGFRDRFADQIGSYAGNLTPGSNRTVHMTYSGRGDIIRACGSGATGWKVEEGGPYKCSELVENSSTGPDAAGLYDDQAEYSMGAIVALDGTQSGSTYGGRLVSTFIDPAVDRSNGTLSFSANDGWLTGHWFTATTPAPSDPWATSGREFGRANSMGDLEAMCDRAPIEVGDRVWRDSDQDGEQDAGEPGISSVRVDLLQNGVVITSAITDAEGRFIFSSGPGVTGNSQRFGLTQLLPGNTGLSVRVDILDPDLLGYVPSTTTGGARPTINSDIYADGGTATFSTTVPGAHRHDLDAGFTGWPTVLAVPRWAIAATVWDDTDADGILDVGEPGRSGVTLQLLSAAGTVLTSTVSDGFGNYHFQGIVAGTYRVRVAPLPLGLQLTTQPVINPLIRSSMIDPATSLSRAIVIGTDPDVAVPTGRNITLAARAIMDVGVGILAPNYGDLPT